MACLDTFEKVVDDAASMSISRATSSRRTLASTVTYGIGSSSGKALMQLGEMMVQGIDSVQIRWRLGRIESALSKDLPTVSLDDMVVLLEYQRIWLYSDSIRTIAWNVIFLALECGVWEQLYEALCRWKNVEIGLFIRQLAICRLSGWSVHPLSSWSSSRFAQNPQSLQSDAMSATMARLLFTMSHTHNELLHSLFNTDCLLLLLSRGTPLAGWGFYLSEWSEDDPRHLTAFLFSWARTSLAPILALSLGNRSWPQCRCSASSIRYCDCEINPSTALLNLFGDHLARERGLDAFIHMIRFAPASKVEKIVDNILRHTSCLHLDTESSEAESTLGFTCPDLCAGEGSVRFHLFAMLLAAEMSFRDDRMAGLFAARANGVEAWQDICLEVVAKVVTDGVGSLPEIRHEECLCDLWELMPRMVRDTTSDTLDMRQHHLRVEARAFGVVASSD